MSFSYSKISLYHHCPKKYYFKYIEKISVPFENKSVFEKGRYIHHIIEHYPNLPEFSFTFKEVENKKIEYLTQINDFIQNNKKMKFLLSKDVMLEREKSFYLDKDLNVINSKSDSIINGVIDYIGQYNNNIILVDWKTGMSQKYASLEQLKLYSLYTFNNYPDINKLKIILFFIEQDIYVYEEITKNDYENIKQNFFDIINTIDNDTVYKCKINEDCIKCEYYTCCKPFKMKVG